MTDNRTVGMKVWLCPPYGETPRQIKVTKVTKTGVTCDDGKRYNFGPGDSWGRLHGSQSKSYRNNAEITTICQQSRVDGIKEREHRLTLISKLDKLMSVSRTTVDILPSLKCVGIPKNF